MDLVWGLVAEAFPGAVVEDGSEAERLGDLESSFAASLKVSLPRTASRVADDFALPPEALTSEGGGTGGCDSCWASSFLCG